MQNRVKTWYFNVIEHVAENMVLNRVLAILWRLYAFRPKFNFNQPARTYFTHFIAHAKAQQHFTSDFLASNGFSIGQLYSVKRATNSVRGMTKRLDWLPKASFVF